MTRSTLMTSNVMSTIVAEQPVEVELGGELLGDLEQHRSLRAWRASPVVGADAELARRPGRPGW